MTTSGNTSKSLQEPYILGLDLGHASIGWAVLRTRDGEPCGVEAAGSRCFDAGVTGAVSAGRDESRAKGRRDKRLQRRQGWRRARRLKKIFRLLQHEGLLPEGDYKNSDSRHEMLLKLDAELRKEHLEGGDRAAEHTLAYRLRAKALQGPLDALSLGRALYHLAQRRGYASNRRGAARDDDEQGVVLGGISELDQKIKDSDSRTLGEYFSKLDPEEERIRERYTSRQMYLDEFEAIWEAQKGHHDVLTDEFREKLHKAFFFQRALRSQKGLVGKCELEPKKRRARWAFRVAQEFRVLQAVVNLAIRVPGEAERFLSREERDQLTRELQTKGDLTFAKARKLLGFKRNWKFNLEEGGEKRIVGNRTESALAGIFGERWWNLAEEDKDQVVLDLISFQNLDALKRRGEKAWGLEGEAAEAFSELELEDGYANLSVAAMEKLLDPMSKGVPYATARKEVYPESFEAGEPVDSLEAVEKALGDLRNPAVSRAMGEIRKVVNALIRRYGKPEKVRIELARDLKRSRKERVRMSSKMRAREKEREAAAEKILSEVKGSRVSGRDVEKVLLAEECGWICPYTGKAITMASLVGSVPQFDVEHILPFSRSQDNSFINKTLCAADENRHVKKNKTPFEAYSGDEEKWAEIIARVAGFKSDIARIKLERFLMQEIDPGFVGRDLSDTRYISSLAADYIGTLYGGRYDSEGKTHIQVSAGRTTAHLRREWQMNSILGGGDEKSRDDHRHHAVDAIVIALTSPSTVKMLARAAVNAESAGRRLFAPLDEPWDGFLDEVHTLIGGINVSRRVSRRINGPLHEDSVLSDKYDHDGKTWRHFRKPVKALTKGEVPKIVDPAVREAVEKALEESGTDNPGKAFADEAALPSLPSSTGRSIKISKVRIRKAPHAIQVGKGSRARNVKPGSNHHMAIVANLDADGNETSWEGHLVSRYDAIRRAAKKQPVVQRDWGEGKFFKFSISPGEYLLLKDGEGEVLTRVTTVFGNSLELVTHADARPMTERTKIPGARIQGSIGKYFKLQAKKVNVSPLGDVTIAND